MITIQNSKIRTILKYFIPFLCIPALTFFGSVILKGEYYLPVAFAGAFLAMILFLAGFEKKKIGSRRLVVVAVMTALSFIGRFLPLLKPMIAITMITAMYLGCEAGFLSGAMAALLSNFYFGQGPWTIFQMLTWGLIGYFAGMFSNPLKKSKILLWIYGIFSGIFYSFSMDVWTVLWYAKGFDWNLYSSALITAIPYTISYIFSNLLFLTLLAEPFGQKLERLQIKYGI
ncbi:MAG: ECF transporter S component [Oscillospiraceae bacterium]|nr:ECF transporter S component [Oscillospiraceae bacterium]